MPSHVDKAFNESMRRIMGSEWKPGGGNPGTKARENRTSSRAKAAPKAQGTKSTSPKRKVKKLPTPTVAGEWSKRTGIPKHLYSSSKEFERKNADMSKLDKYGRPTHTKDGEWILRFR
jgi:hypothetical protein